MNQTRYETREAMLVLAMYEDYIRLANEENRYQDGWSPVCINEYQDVEYEDYLSDPEAFEVTLNEDTLSLLKTLSAVDLLRLANDYDEYIQTANEVEAYRWDEGTWKPLLVGEFLKANPKTVLNVFKTRCEGEDKDGE